MIDALVPDPVQFAQRQNAIERATPDWVRRCRGMNHAVVVMSAIKQPDGTYAVEWFCTQCGKDRRR